MNRMPFAAQAIAPSLAIALALSLASTAAQASVNIASAATKNMSCSAGVCSPTAKKAVLNVGDLASMLQTSDTKVVTGSGAVTIEVTAPFSWASASRLTLDANLNVSIKARVTVTGQGGLTIVTNDGGSGGDLLFPSGGKVDFWALSGSLVVNGRVHTLVNNIATLTDDIAADPTGAFALANDYYASKDGVHRFSPIGTPVKGIVEGLGHTIMKLTVKKAREKCIGLFSQISAGGTVRDINLRSAHLVIVHHSNVGALVGCNSGLVANAYSDGSVQGSSGRDQKAGVGGLVGFNDQGTVSNSVSVATVSGDDGSFVGGLVGHNGDSSLAYIVGSHATGAAFGGTSGAVGGLVGYSGPGGTIFQSYATGPASGGFGELVGGLSGQQNGTVTQSYATGAVSGGDSASVGGLVGYGNDIMQSYATGPVQTTGSGALVGGLAGSGGGGDQSYAIGAVSGGSDSIIGGLIGYVDGLTAHAYWDTETSGQSIGCGGAAIGSDCSGVTGLTTQQFQSGLPAGFDPAVWGENPNINGGFPYLLALPPAE